MVIVGGLSQRRKLLGYLGVQQRLDALHRGGRLNRKTLFAQLLHAHQAGSVLLQVFLQLGDPGLQLGLSLLVLLRSCCGSAASR